MDPFLQYHLLQNRRQFFGDLGLRLGGVALAMMAGQQLAGTASALPSLGGRVHPPLPGLPHFKPKAKSIIYLHMNGGPSQIDTFDYKPGMKDFFDKDLPPSVQGGQRL